MFNFVSEELANVDGKLESYQRGEKKNILIIKIVRVCVFIYGCV